MGGKRIELNKTYGDLYVKSLGTRSYKTYICVCNKCGSQLELSGQSIYKNQNNGGCRHCRKTARNKTKLLDSRKYIGQTFNSLKIIDTAIHHYNGYNQIFAQCQCLKCGCESEILLYRVINGIVKECKHCSHQNLELGKNIIKVASKEGTNILDLSRKNINKNNTTGYTGVSYIPSIKQYRSYITFKRKQYHLGCFANIEEAVAARKEAEQNIHGQFLIWYAQTYPKQWEEMNRYIKSPITPK